MNLVISKLLSLLIVVCCCCAQVGAQTTRSASAQMSAAPSPRVVPQILAHSAQGIFWIALADGPTDKPATQIYWRNEGDPGQWHWLVTMPLGLRELASKGIELAGVAADGQWLVIRDYGTSFGQPLPGGAILLALANDREHLWALGQLASSAMATSAPSDKQTVIGIWKLEENQWKSQGQLPADPQAAGRYSLGILDGRAVVAELRGRQVNVRVAESESKWRVLLQTELPFDAADFELLDDSRRAVLWAAPARGAGRLMQVGSEPVELAWNGPPPSAGRRAAVLAAGRLRVLALADGKVSEQRYDAQSGKPIEGLTDMAINRPQPPAAPNSWITWLSMGMLLAVMLGTFKRRRGSPELAVNLGEFSLAPLGARFMAGMIDFAPIWITAFYVASKYSASPDAFVRVREPAAQLPLAIATAIYIGHTLVTELLTGRSLGKMIFGLRVVGLDGQPARPGAIVIRNLLRLIDVSMLITLLTVFYFPLRQRLGDLAARTVVVIKKKAA